MNAYDTMMNLLERGFELDLQAGRLKVYPAENLTDEDRANIRANLPALKRLCSPDHSDYAEGWSLTPDIPNRAALVRNGRLLDSCLFRTAGGAENFLHRVQSGEPPNLAFSAACAAEDAVHKTNPTPSTEFKRSFS